MGLCAAPGCYITLPHTGAFRFHDSSSVTADISLLASHIPHPSPSSPLPHPTPREIARGLSLRARTIDSVVLLIAAGGTHTACARSDL